MAIYFTADEHYGHHRIIEYCKRPFADTDEMTEQLIARHNAKVSRGDLTYHIGDMFWRSFGLEAALSVMDRLNGQHFFVLGNHDELIEENEELQKRFVWIRDIGRVHVKRVPRIVLCHYAMRVWRGSSHGAWHLYGHTHGALPDYNLSFDVGVDANGFAPVSLEEVMVRMYEKQGERAFRDVAILDKMVQLLRDADAGVTPGSQAGEQL